MSSVENRVGEILSRYPKGASSVIGVLQDIHREFNYLPAEALKRSSHGLEVPLSRLFSVATFYKSFSLKPRGKHLVRVCMGTACHVRGSSVLHTQLSEQLKVKDRETTTDGKYTLESVNCVGTCAMAPVVVLDEKVHGKVQPSDIEGMIKK